MLTVEQGSPGSHRYGLAAGEEEEEALPEPQLAALPTHVGSARVH